MSNKKLDPLIQQMENYLECWKQFNHFINLARAKKFSAEDESQFLEVKSVLIQELEVILAAVEVPYPTKEDVHNVIGSAPSLRFLSEMSDGALRSLETPWHKVYIGWHSVLGQLKVRERSQADKSTLGGIFGSGKKDKDKGK